MAAFPSFAPIEAFWTDEQCLDISRKTLRREEISRITYQLRKNLSLATAKIRAKSLSHLDGYDFSLPVVQSSCPSQSRNSSPGLFKAPLMLPTPAAKKRIKKFQSKHVKKAISVDIIRMPERHYQSSPIRKFSTMKLQSSPIHPVNRPPALRESKNLNISSFSSSPLAPRTPPRFKDSDADLLLHLATSPSTATPSSRSATLTSPSRFTLFQSGNPQTPRDFRLEDFFNASPSPLAKTPGRKLNYDPVENISKITSGEKLTFGSELVQN